MTEAGRARRSLFETPARLSDGRMTNLRISLPPGFPAARPSLAVTHPLMHAWVRPVPRRRARSSCALQVLCWEAVREARPCRQERGSGGGCSRPRGSKHCTHNSEDCQERANIRPMTFKAELAIGNSPAVLQKRKL